MAIMETVHNWFLQLHICFIIIGWKHIRSLFLFLVSEMIYFSCPDVNAPWFVFNSTSSRAAVRVFPNQADPQQPECQSNSPMCSHPGRFTLKHPPHPQSLNPLTRTVAGQRTMGICEFVHLRAQFGEKALLLICLFLKPSIGWPTARLSVRGCTARAM